MAEISLIARDESEYSVDHPSPDRAPATKILQPLSDTAETRLERNIARDQPPVAGDVGQTVDLEDKRDDKTRAPRLRVGERDAHGDIVECIFAATNRYVIYSANSLVRFDLPPDREIERTLRERVAPLGGLRASIDSLRSERPIDDRESLRAAREVAWALGEAFDDQTVPQSTQPKEILVRVDDRLRSLVKSYFRKKYVFANLGAFAAIEAFMLIVVGALAFSTISSLPVKCYAFYGMLGGLGAFLSVIVGIKSIDLDINLGRWEYAFTGATRILIGVIGAWIVALALDSGLFDPTFGHRLAIDDKNLFGFSPHQAMYFVLSIVGGFSETLVPNLLRRGEEAATASNDKAVTKGPIVNGLKP